MRRGLSRISGPSKVSAGVALAMCSCVYGVLRNALWDDAAESVTGNFATDLARKAEEEHYSSGVVGPYLAWRYSYLWVGVVFGLVQAVLSSPWLSDSDYSLFLESQVSSSIPRDRFQPLVHTLLAIDVVMWCLALLALLGTLLALCLARPSAATSTLRLGRRVVWVTWLISFLPPFLLFLTFPMRSMVDWDAITADVCVSSITASGDMAGSSLSSNLRILHQIGALEESMLGLATDPFQWCMSKGDSWHTIFFNQSVPCTWFVEDRCRQMSCERLTAGSTTERQCIQDCVKFTLDTAGSQARTSLTQLMQECDASVAQKTYAPAALQQQMRAASLSGDVSQSDLVNAMSIMQRFSIIQLAESLTFASTQAEYAVGMLLAVMVGQNMISAALGLANGMAEALINMKAMFPGTQAGGWILMLTTFEVLPIYIVLLAVFQQMIGDPTLAIGVVGATLYLAVGIHTGYRITGTKGGESGRWHVYRLIWVEYGLRFIFGVGTLVACIMWTLQKNLGESLIAYIHEDLLM